MKNIKTLIASLFIALVPASAADDPGEPFAASSPPGNPAPPGDMEKRADARLQEMLNRMQAAVEDVAQMYGNPVFLQVFTNDAERAAELKVRLRSAKKGEEIESEMKELERKRDELLNDIALKEREAARLSARLARQRAALDGLAGAIEQARKAVEDSSR